MTSFQNFLNALPCQIQILVRVREVDVDKYVEDLEAQKHKEPEAIYQQQIKNYSEFVQKLVSGNTILSRRFYIVIPYHNPERGEDWQLIKEHLNLNVDIITKGLERMQMKAKPLTSLEIINLFYAFYNFDSLKTQPLTYKSLEALLKHDYV